MESSDQLSTDGSITPPSQSIASSTAGVWKLLREFLETAILTLLIFLLVRAVVQNYRVKGSSMEPNIHDGQYLMVNKALNLFPLQRGDVVIFVAPPRPRDDFIKRVVALPGETVEIRQGRVYIKRPEWKEFRLLDEPYVPHFAVYSYGPATVGPDQYFVLGDNRGNSDDSHSWGMLPRKNIIGKAWLSYWPIKTFGLLPRYTLAFSP